MNNWVAEDLPAYQINRSLPQPTTDEGSAMSAPSVIGRSDERGATRNLLVAQLIRNRASMQRFVVDTEQRKTEAAWYNAAIEAFDAGITMVRVYGRIYRLRNTAACVPQHSMYGTCPNCTPVRYPVFTWSA